MLYLASQFFSCSWFSSILPHAPAAGLQAVANCLRLCFALLLIFIVYWGIRHPGREGWFALPAVVLVSIGLFAQELSVLHIPGIWFPYGTGVSRTQFADAAFDFFLFALLLRRLLLYARLFRQPVLDPRHPEQA